MPDLSESCADMARCMDWEAEFSSLIQSSEQSILICSPYISADGVRFVTQHASSRLRERGAIHVVTDLSPLNICMGSTEPEALQRLRPAAREIAITHLPKLHAKVYIADEAAAIVTSANLTAGGLHRNYEYGIRLRGALCGKIRRDVCEYAALGASVCEERLAAYAGLAQRVRETYRAQQRQAAAAARREFHSAVQAAERELLRLRLRGGAMHTVFERTIRYLLTRRGPLSTRELHPLIAQLHPDLCDDTVDRIIDGKNYGKRWKHAVRTAQQHLKATGMIQNRGDRWFLSEPMAAKPS